MIRRSTELIERPRRDCIYDVLRHLDLNLCVDVGAAAGHATRQICLVGGANVQVVAFEPFSGNYPYFHKSVEGLKNSIRLIEKAASDRIGTSRFIVDSVVQGTEPGWREYAGYSSVGFLTSGYGPRYLKSTFKRLLGAVLNRPRPRVLKVETTTIDSEFPKQTIDFMKIDVQGAEAQVLYGAEAALEANRIRVMYIEWSGERAVVELLNALDYQVYDSTYVAGAKTLNAQPFRELGFGRIEKIKLSPGKTASEMVLEDGGISPAEAIHRVQQRNLGWIQTDLIAISPDARQWFQAAARKYSAEQARSGSGPGAPEA